MSSSESRKARNSISQASRAEISQLNAAMALERSQRSNPLGLLPGALYLMVSSPTYQPLGNQSPLPMAKRWHWSLYCHAGEMGGRWYHIRRVDVGKPGARITIIPVHDIQKQLPTVNGWRFEMLHVENVLESIPVVCALKIAKLDDTLRQELSRRISNVAIKPAISGLGFDGNDSIEEGISSCQWVLNALFELDQEGWIGIRTTVGVEALYNETVDTAVRAEQLDAPLVRESINVIF